MFQQVLAELESVRWRPELQVGEMPAPQRLAPFSAAISADVVVRDADLGTGRLVLLHDPDGNPAWSGTFRLVMFARATVDAEMAEDPLLTEVGWSWLLESLTNHHAEYAEPSGTVTVVTSRSFGAIADQTGRAEVEIRASWTPTVDADHGLTPHCLAWGDLLCTLAGIPALPEGVVPLTRIPGQ